MATINILFKNRYAINDDIGICIPTVEEVLDNEDSYYGLVAALTAMPMDLMVQLDDAGIDFTTIDEYELFLMLFKDIQRQGLDTHLIFGDLDISKFEIMVNSKTNQVVLYDRQNDIVIDRLIQNQIANTLRKIHNLEKNDRRPGNEEGKIYLLDLARRKMKRHRRSQESQLEQIIISMVNTEQYKYNYESTKQLTIYQFNESVKQVIRKINYDNRMHGVYSGTINTKDLSQDDFNWLAHSDK